MVPTAVNPSYSHGGGNKAPLSKKQAQLGFSQGKAGSTPKTSEKKQHPNTPGWGKMAAGKGNNGGGGGIGTGIMEVDPVFATPTRGSSLPLPSCGWAEAPAWSHKGENTPNTQGSIRETEEATGDTGKESPLQGTRLSGKFSKFALDGVHIASTGSFPQLNKTDESELGPAHNLYRGTNFLK